MEDDAPKPRPDAPHVAPEPAEAQPRSARPVPRCRTCDIEMRFAGGQSTHDLWAERYVCPKCGRETFRSYGRGSV